MELGSSTMNNSVSSGVDTEVNVSSGSGIGTEASITSGSRATVDSGSGINEGSATKLISGVGEASGNAAKSGFWVSARISVTKSAVTRVGVGKGTATTTTISTSSVIESEAGETGTEVSGKFSAEKKAPAFPSELLDSAFKTDENNEPAEEPPTTKVASKATVSFAEVFTL